MSFVGGVDSSQGQYTEYTISNAGVGDDLIVNGKRKFTNIPEVAPVV